MFQHDYLRAVFNQAVSYYRGTKLTAEELRKDIYDKWPSQRSRIEDIITKVLKS